jgi:hypothetical protein
MTFDRAALITQGWSIGSFINIARNDDLFEYLPSQTKELVGQRCFLVPLLYDCALLHENFDVEPWAQCVLINECQINNAFGLARDPRKYHFPVNEGNKETHFEAIAAGIVQIPRLAVLRGFIQDKIEWPEGGLTRLLSWIIQRINQSAFPDEWNKRTKTKNKQFKRIWENHSFSSYCSDVLLKITPFHDLEINKDYKVSIFVVLPYSGKTAKDIGYLFNNKPDAQTESLIQRIKACFNSCEGITVESIDTIFEEQLTRQIEKQYKRLVLESYSYKINPQGQLPRNFMP